MKFGSNKKVPPVKEEASRIMAGRDQIELGRKGEQAAANYLVTRGYKLLKRNLRRGKRGEADLVLLDRKTLVFCEVKTKRSLNTGHAAENFRKQQQTRLRALILKYLQNSDWQGPLRVDLLTLQKKSPQSSFQILHYKNVLELDDNW